MNNGDSSSTKEDVARFLREGGAKSLDRVKITDVAWIDDLGNITEAPFHAIGVRFTICHYTEWEPRHEQRHWMTIEALVDALESHVSMVDHIR